MLKKTIVDLLNKQINKEFFSAYLYLDMANYYAEKGLDGFANWFQVQAKEEEDHGMLIRTYLLNNDEIVKFTAIADPSKKYKDFEQPLKDSLAHEEEITASIHAIYDVAFAEKDFRTTQFLDWFVMEQGEEEKNATDLITKYNLFGTDAKGLYMLDQEQGARVYTAPSLVL